MWIQVVLKAVNGAPRAHELMKAGRPMFSNEDVRPIETVVTVVTGGDSRYPLSGRNQALGAPVIPPAGGETTHTPPPPVSST